MHTITAILDVTDSELAKIEEVASACGIQLPGFLGHCLARGLLAIVEEYQAGARISSLGPPHDTPHRVTDADEIPF